MYSSHLAIHRIVVETGTLHSIMIAFLLSLLRRLAPSACVLRVLSTLPGCVRYCST
jgi:hypothetical protein